MILLHTSERSINVLRIRSEEEVSAKQARRKKREREKGRKKGAEDANVIGETELDGGGEIKWSDRIQGWCTIRTNAKIRAFSLATEDSVSSKSGISVSIAKGLTRRLC